MPSFLSISKNGKIPQKFEDIKPFISNKLQSKNLQIDTDINKPLSNCFPQSATNNNSRMLFTTSINGPLTVKNNNQNNQNVNNPHHLNSPSHILGKNNPLPNHEATKCSYKRNGIVKAYAANTLSRIIMKIESSLNHFEYN